MTKLEQEILHTLTALATAAKAPAAPAPKPDLLALLQRLDDLTLELPREAHPDLRHYLQRKSYEKARLWLLGRGAENTRGACGH